MKVSERDALNDRLSMISRKIVGEEIIAWARQSMLISPSETPAVRTKRLERLSELILEECQIRTILASGNHPQR